MDIYFKLFHSIKQPDEIELARLEIQSLLGGQLELEEIWTTTDLILKSGFSDFLDRYPEKLLDTKGRRFTFQRYLEYETAYTIKGFLVLDIQLKSVDSLVRRLAYTREIFCIIKGEKPTEALKVVLKRGVEGVNVLAFRSTDGTAIRAIVDQYYLGATEYISKISPGLAKRGKLDDFIQELKFHLVTGLDRIPASTRARVGKRFLDYLAERQEPSLHLFHGLHPYKGKFHPKLARSLLNIIYPASSGLVMDNFSGSGTTLVEAAFLGLDSIGIDVNPMSVLMARAKLACFHISVDDLDDAIKRFFQLFDKEVQQCRTMASGQNLLKTSKHIPSEEDINGIKETSENTYNIFKGNASLQEILISRSIIGNELSGWQKDILMLGLAIVISNGKRSKKLEVRKELLLSFENICRRIYIFSALKDLLQLTPGKGQAIKGSTANMSQLGLEISVDGIVNSPPYSTALDYVRNDLDQLVLLGLVGSKADLDALGKQMGGNPRLRFDEVVVGNSIDENECDMPSYSLDIIKILREYGRKEQAFRLYKFYELMIDAMAEQKRVMKPGARAATVIGNNLLKLKENIRINDHHLHFDSRSRCVKKLRRSNNVKSIDRIVVNKEDIDSFYSDNAPISTSEILESNKIAHLGVYLEVENDRSIALISESIGFECELLIYRYLEKTRRGDIRWETVVILENPE